MLKKDLISIRKIAEADKNFIYSTWLDGVYYGNDLYKTADKIQFKNKYKKFLYKVMENSKTEVQIACLKDDPDIILGYAVFEGSTLHFVYVKAAWRKIGLAKDLIPKDLKNISIYSPLTDIGLGILGQKYVNVGIIPYQGE